MSVKRAVLIAVILAILVGIIFSFTSSSFGTPQLQVTSDSTEYSIRLVNKKGLEQFLKDAHFWEWKNQFTQNKPVRKLVITFTDKPQSLNIEEKKTDKQSLIIGSVGSNFSGNTLTLLIHSDPSVIEEIPQNWHIEAQLLRFINGHTDAKFKLENRALFLKYLHDVPLFFHLNEN